MIRICYFARYRELLGIADEQLEWLPHLSSIEDLRRVLISRGGAWSALTDSTLMYARNSEMCSACEPVSDGDEIAFFPQVTGG
ncbi:MoaD/ThiS family protein [Pseudomonas chlororaphis]|uniref:MoaD/ThiS family protein n=1 Tax=Pseudomonas chlororaphis TaxID=587753 RepID=UPI00209B77E6|nr:MoaD/ThiS family protein [Pseudomonas chlororaphis]MCO7570824.1 MoaD/ThiS family protein [Pseudomonas chlororaphis]MCO7588656.1 MoaD/ThiS family protein [Pseudomonas chlororaphis]